MTVAELVRRLSQYPAEARVQVWDAGCEGVAPDEWHEILSVSLCLGGSQGPLVRLSDHPDDR